jgi:hypothetical protein
MEKNQKSTASKSGWEKTGAVFQSIGIWIWRLRGLLMAVPVAIAALYLAGKNMSRLPEEVGINLLANGEYQYLISRNLAVVAPLLVTGGCLVLMMLSRKTVYPWIISIFTLVLPILIWFTNVFPA